MFKRIKYELLVGEEWFEANLFERDINAIRDMTQGYLICLSNLDIVDVITVKDFRIKEVI